MKGFTVCQPFALAIMLGMKGNETKPQRTHIRGRVFIHAGAKDLDAALKGFPTEQRETIIALQHESPLCDEVKARGAIIGTVEIVDCQPVEEVLPYISERERVLGDYSPGRFAWKLQNPVLFKTPIPAKGKLGWWTWDESEGEQI